MKVDLDKIGRFGVGRTLGVLICIAVLASSPDALFKGIAFAGIIFLLK